MDLSYQAIKAALLQMDAACRSLVEDEISKAPYEVYRDHLEKLNELAAAPVPDAVVSRLMNEPGLHPAIRRISKLKRENGLKLEVQCAETIIVSPDPCAHVEHFIYFPNYVSLADMEYAGAGLQAGDSVVFLGSGPLPLTLICLARQYGVRGIGIEKDEGIAALSKEVIKMLGLERRIRVVRGNHFALPLEEPSKCIMVGADAMPKKEIFAHLAKILPSGHVISYRIYEKGLRRLFDEASLFTLPCEFREYGRIRPEPPVNNTCVFAVRI